MEAGIPMTETLLTCPLRIEIEYRIFFSSLSALISSIVYKTGLRIVYIKIRAYLYSIGPKLD